jgi:hypothetical protein
LIIKNLENTEGVFPNHSFTKKLSKMRLIFLFTALVIFSQNLFSQIKTTDSNFRNETVRVGIGAGWTGYNYDSRFTRLGFEYERQLGKPKSRYVLLTTFDYGVDKVNYSDNLLANSSGAFFKADFKNYKLDLSVVKTVWQIGEWGKFGLGGGMSAYHTALDWTDSTFQRIVPARDIAFELVRQTRKSLTVNRLGAHLLTTFDTDFTNGLTIGFRGGLLIKFNRDDQRYIVRTSDRFGTGTAISAFGSYVDRTLMLRVGKKF